MPNVCVRFLPLFTVVPAVAALGSARGPLEVDLKAVNPKDAPFGEVSARMNFRDYDLALEDALNRILWADAKPGVPYPTPIHGALFVR